MKKEKLKQACRYVRKTIAALIETLVSAVLVVILYALYLPFGSRIHKREEE